MPPSSTLLSTGEVAEILGTTVSTVNRWASSGRLPVAKQIPGLRGARLFRPSDVERLRRQAVATPQDVAS